MAQGKERLARFGGEASLFHAWLDCFALAQLGGAEVCAYRVLPILNNILNGCWTRNMERPIR